MKVNLNQRYANKPKPTDDNTLESIKVDAGTLAAFRDLIQWRFGKTYGHINKEASRALEMYIYLHTKGEDF